LEDFSEVMLLMYFSFYLSIAFFKSGYFPVLEKGMLFLFLKAILPPVMAFYDLAGVLPLLFLFFSPLLFPACPETALHNASLNVA
jgi:hypothetical protein